MWSLRRFELSKDSVVFHLKQLLSPYWSTVSNQQFICDFWNHKLTLVFLSWYSPESQCHRINSCFNLCHWKEKFLKSTSRAWNIRMIFKTWLDKMYMYMYYIIVCICQSYHIRDYIKRIGQALCDVTRRFWVTTDSWSWLIQKWASLWSKQTWRLVGTRQPCLSWHKIDILA